MVKYGILYKPEDVYVIWYSLSKGEDVLFSSLKSEVENALQDILLADGGYDGNFTDFKIIEHEIKNPYYDGASFASKAGEDGIFVSRSLVEKELENENKKGELE